MGLPSIAVLILLRIDYKGIKMNTKLSTILKSNRMLVHILSILVILAIAFPATGNVNALIESAPPAGGHDGSEGVGHANSCNAYGWAQDPDDTTREVQVRILDTGNEIASGSTEVMGSTLISGGFSQPMKNTRS